MLRVEIIFCNGDVPVERVYGIDGHKALRYEWNNFIPERGVPAECVYGFYGHEALYYGWHNFIPERGVSVECVYGVDRHKSLRCELCKHKALL